LKLVNETENYIYKYWASKISYECSSTSDEFYWV